MHLLHTFIKLYIQFLHLHEVERFIAIKNNNRFTLVKVKKEEQRRNFGIVLIY